MSIETNPLITADFPEVCFPSGKGWRVLSSEAKAAFRATDYIDWRDDRLVMPTIKDSIASGAIFESVSITSANIRGKNHLTASGKMIRPDFCIIDDPQTEESAASTEQCKKRAKVISKSIIHMAGPGKKNHRCDALHQ